MTAPVNTRIVIHTQVRDRTSRQPSRRSRRTDGDAEAVTVSPRWRGRTRANNSALRTNVAASSANASPAPTPSTSAVASSGPIRKARFAVVSLSALASWICDSGTVCGIRPVYAGWKNACAAPNAASIRTMCQIRTVPVKINAASAACKAARVRSVTIMIL
jgi:hypothetical protein